jgi:hypothetical protein
LSQGRTLFQATSSEGKLNSAEDELHDQKEVEWRQARVREDKAELHPTEGTQAEIQRHGSENGELGREN